MMEERRDWELICDLLASERELQYRYIIPWSIYSDAIINFNVMDDTAQAEVYKEDIDYYKVHYRVKDCIQNYIKYLQMHDEADQFLPNEQVVAEIKVEEEFVIPQPCKITIHINLSDAHKFINWVDDLIDQPLTMLPDIKQVLDYLEGGDANTNANI